MRELKFRCWGIKENKYLKLHSIHLSTSKVIVSYYGVGGGNISKELKDVVLEQYTGLKDKNGKEIYDGDIVDYLGECTCVIQYEDEGARFIHRDISDDFPFGFNGLEEYNGKLFEVIGNIHENPELLENTK